MKKPIIFAAVLGAILVGIIANDTRAKQIVTARVEDVYVRYDGEVNVRSIGVLEEAEKAIGKALKRVLILPYESHDKALQVIKDEHYAALFVKDDVDSMKAKMRDGEGPAVEGNNSFFQERIDASMIRHRERVREFKDKLSFLRGSI